MTTTVQLMKRTVVVMCGVLAADALNGEASAGQGTRTERDKGMNRRSMFGPRSFRDGRVQVYGCSPGCLLVSLLVSVVLTIVLNVVLNLF
ncbi:MAG: hypothetical protein AVDCRST_MAG87-3935 [uncultured Thermomicrobiales bacterium]|uniref:Uncharacterized protein n=1 Tax=uncultured Thermomicrobiales bacterium TaxID=1645740 RepID=A0A6J4VSS3_9BACT|nr:MAG: hypothetical protein AVDCRST_MAG87-3935 [uncultured Thermomicrobiales bacterium]